MKMKLSKQKLKFDKINSENNMEFQNEICELEDRVFIDKNEKEIENDLL